MILNSLDTYIMNNRFPISMSLEVLRSSSQKDEKEPHVQKRADFYQTSTI